MLISNWRILDIIIKQALTQADFFKCMMVRGRVFVDEQHISSSIEIDETDQTCLHFLALIDEQPVGALRAIPCDGYTKLGRICVLQKYRHLGIGKALVNAVMDKLQGEFHLDAQISAIDFYTSLGFTAYGEPFMEANIQHIAMKATRRKS